MAINLKSVFWVTKHGIPHLQRAGGGSIIMMGSVSALAGFTRAQDAYTAAKGALISLTKSLAIQFARDRIRCNVIHPGIVDTPLQAPYLTDDVRKEFATGIPARPHRRAARDRAGRAVPGQRRVLLHDGRRAGRGRWLHRRLSGWRVRWRLRDSRTAPTDVVSIAGALLVVALAALILYPVATVTVWGLRAWRAARGRRALAPGPGPPEPRGRRRLHAGGAPAGRADRLRAGARERAGTRHGSGRVCRLGVLLPPFVAPLALLVLAGPRGLVAGVFGPGGSLPGVVAIVIGQAIGFFPWAVALVVRALAAVPVEMEQAAETLGAGRLTVVRRVTLGLAGPRVGAAALVLVVLCLSDVGHAAAARR